MEDALHREMDVFPRTCPGSVGECHALTGKQVF